MINIFISSAKFINTLKYTVVHRRIFEFTSNPFAFHPIIDVTVTGVSVPVSSSVIGPLGIVGMSTEGVLTNITFAVVVFVNVLAFFSVVDVTSADYLFVVLGLAGGVGVGESVLADLELTSIVVTNTVVVVVNVVALYCFVTLVAEKILVFVYVLSAFYSCLASVTEKVTVGVYVNSTGLGCVLCAAREG